MEWRGGPLSSLGRASAPCARRSGRSHRRPAPGRGTGRVKTLGNASVTRRACEGRRAGIHGGGSARLGSALRGQVEQFGRQRGARHAVDHSVMHLGDNRPDRRPGLRPRASPTAAGRGGAAGSSPGHHSVNSSFHPAGQRNPEEVIRQVEVGRLPAGGRPGQRDRHEPAP